ncbi:MAG TPA: hypothetical protein VD968_14005 [Pyrinomonadaceae bacterium]|nr:hypothetical protein [Pyrinomonadaceae bacterium]
MLKGAIHTHSTYSDGDLTLGELREAFVAEGCRFAMMTDHAEYFDAARLRDYVSECESLSDDRFLFVAGLEYECEHRMHLLGYGVTSLAGTTDPQRVIEHIKGEGGVSVIAHPMNSMFDWIETFDALPDGIETWNTKYDGQYAPRPGTFRLLARLQERAPRMRAFYGMDLHWKDQPRAIFNLVRRDEPARDALLEAFRGGDYTGLKDGAELPSDGALPADVLARYGEVNDRYMRKQRLFRSVKKFSGAVGRGLPEPVKARIRRIFS